MLDEGVDVPDANLGIVMSASRTRRQMVQRMGRILRRKQPGVAARFVIMFAKDTLEDPDIRTERDGFLDEIERISEATRVFDSAHLDALDTFLAEPGPEVVPEPAHLERYRRAPRRPRSERAATRSATSATCSPPRWGWSPPTRSLQLRPRGSSDPQREAALRRLDARLSRPTADAPYLEIELAKLLEIAKPASQAPDTVDWSGADRDRTGGIPLADQLHRWWRA